MSDLNPIVLFSILSEFLGTLLWPFIVAALIAGLVVVVAAIRLHRRGRLGHAAIAGLMAWVIVSGALVLFLPAWTLAGLDAFASPLDVFLGFLMALIPGSLAGVLVFAQQSLGQDKTTLAGAGRAPARP